MPDLSNLPNRLSVEDILMNQPIPYTFTQRSAVRMLIVLAVILGTGLFLVWIN